MPFQAILIKQQQNQSSANLESLQSSDFPQDESWDQLAVEIDVDYSSLNYKDALAITGTSPVVRRFPMVPGIDLAGTVRLSSHPDWQPGDSVILNGFGIGELYWGGLAQRARVNGDWLIRRPASLSTRDAMIIGTAGYTAMLSVLALEEHGLKPADGEILVTGASGGVGSIAVALLTALGYSVVAASGKTEAEGYLRALGATRCIDRSELNQPGKPLAKERWAGVIDSVGSHTLANACSATQRNGIVAACGLAQGMDFPATVAPFILRGITLRGIDSVYAPLERRQLAWEKLATLLDSSRLNEMATEISLADTLSQSSKLLKGKIKGRLLVNVNT